MNIRKWSYSVTSPSPASAGGGSRGGAETMSSQGTAEPGPVVEDARASSGLSAPSSPTDSKTLKDQVQELSRLVDGAIEDLEQVLRAFRMIERDL